MIPLTGPQMLAGPELAEAASQALGTKMEFQSVKESEAKKILSSEQGEEIDEAEKAYILEYCASAAPCLPATEVDPHSGLNRADSLVREGKTNYVAGRPTFKQITGQDLTLPAAFFESYQDQFKRKRRRTTKDE